MSDREGHRLTPPRLAGGEYTCECGKWGARIPERGARGMTTPTARMGSLKAAHGAHVYQATKAALLAARKVQP
jgi:hypothetical protein